MRRAYLQTIIVLHNFFYCLVNYSVSVGSYILGALRCEGVDVDDHHELHEKSCVQ